MSNKTIKITSVIYLIVAAAGVVYSHYFTNTLYYQAARAHYDLLINGYFLVAQPAICFSLGAFAAIVIYELLSVRLADKWQKVLAKLATLCVVVYGLVVLLVLMDIWSLPLRAFLSEHPLRLLWVLLGAVFGVAYYKK